MDFWSYPAKFGVAAFPDSLTLKLRFQFQVHCDTDWASVTGIVPFEYALQQFKKYDAWKENAYAFSKNKNSSYSNKMTIIVVLFCNNWNDAPVAKKKKIVMLI